MLSSDVGTHACMRSPAGRKCETTSCLCEHLNIVAPDYPQFRVEVAGRYLVCQFNFPFASSHQTIWGNLSVSLYSRSRPAAGVDTTKPTRWNVTTFAISLSPTLQIYQVKPP